MKKSIPELYNDVQTMYSLVCLLKTVNSMQHSFLGDECVDKLDLISLRAHSFSMRAFVELEKYCVALADSLLELEREVENENKNS